MSKEIYNKEETKEKLLLGIKKLHDIVSVTMGPNGRTVAIIDQYNKPTVTKDGVSVARSVQLKDIVENLGAELIKQAAEKTLEEAGDGTTTATVLAYALINNLKDHNYNEVLKVLNETIPEIIKDLKNNSRKLKDEDIKYVAAISANNDLQIAKLIEQAFAFSNIVKIEKTVNEIDSITSIEGMMHNVSYFSKMFINNKSRGECYLEDPYVLILNNKIDSLNGLEKLFNDVYKNDSSLLIIADEISEKALSLMEKFVIQNKAKFCVIKSPGFAKHRIDLLNDIAKFTNSIVLKNINNLSVNCLGKLKSCTIYHDRSLLVKNEDIDIEDYVKELQSFEKTLIGSDKDLLTKRIEKLIGKISIINVGGKTESEIKEKYDRYDDAVRAVASALEEGIVEGGGIALFNLIPKDFENIEPIKSQLYRSLFSPNVKIHENGFVFGGNMFEQNIIDPLKVTRCALENAVSVTKTILSIDGTVINEYLWNK